jgi:eukaryotic-like serine/threonine-protein kinase
MRLCSQCGAELEGAGPDGLCGKCRPGDGMATVGMTMATVGMTMATVAFEASTGRQSTVDDDSFGNYQVQRVLGEGGMGTVYMAEQTAPIRRMVALKVVKLGMDTSHVLSRFAYERQALAMMDHPNIARVYDASATAKGRPFFVMEFVGGIPITKYCDDHRLNTEQRLKLFLPICEAVQHAHQKGIIHRDLKPTNVLVMEVDGRPIAKVIDFGIAKAMDQTGGDDNMLTQLGQFVGTPEYMSPEQADPMNQTVDATSDVYSLGVMLYELLVGAVPFDSTSMRKSGLVELMRVIREDEAPTLAAKLTGLGRTATEIAQMRGTALVSLRKELAGDLNWIVMKAVEKNRQRRYATAAELAADIRRHLENRPVLASPPSRYYRVSKFVRRNRLAVLAGSVAAAALLVGFATAIWQAGIARRERAVAIQQRSVAEARGREAAIEKQRAEEQAANARRQEEAAERQSAIAKSRLEDVSALANSMLFEVDDRVRELPGAMPAREVLMQRGLDYLNRMSAETPESARLQQQLGAAYLKMGALQWDPDGSNLRDLNGARDSYGRSATLLETQLQANPRDGALRHQLTLAYLRHAQLLLDSDREQRAGYDQALRSAQKLAADEPANLQAKDDLAEVYLAMAQLARAVEIRRQILAAGPKTAETRWKLYSAETTLALSLIQKDDDQALAILTGVLSGLDALHAEEPASVRYQRDRGLVLRYIGAELTIHNRFAEGIARVRDSLAIQTQLAQADTRNAGFQLDLSRAESLLGTVLVDAGQNAEGMQHLQKALATQEEQASAHPENPDFALSAAGLHNQLASKAGVQSDRATILTHRQAAASLLRTLVRDHPGSALYARSLAAQLVIVGDAQVAAGDRAGAAATYREAVKAADRLGAGAPTDEDWNARADAHAGAARGAFALNRVDESIAEDRLAIADYLRISPGNAQSKAAQHTLSQTWSHLSFSYGSRGDYKAAVDASLKALPYAEAEYAADSRGYAVARSLWNALGTLRNWYTNLGDYGHAVEIERRAVDIAEKTLAAQPGDLNRMGLLSLSYATLGSALRGGGHREESLAGYRRAATVLDGKPFESIDSGPLRRQWADYYLAVIRGLYLWEEPQEALPVCRRVLPVLEAQHRAEPNNEAYRAELVTVYRAAETVYVNSGMPQEGLATSQKILELEGANPRRDAPYWLNQGVTQAKIGSLEAGAGKSEAAQASWKKALELFEKGRGEASKVHAEHGDDRAALSNLAMAERRMALLDELLGNRTEALGRIKEAIAHQAALADADSATPLWAVQLRNFRAEGVRIEWLIDGEQGDYQSLLPRGAATPARIRQELGWGWEQYAGQLAAVLYPIQARLEAGAKAVELERQAADSRPASQVDLAESLGQLGSFQFVRFQEGAEKADALRAAERSYAEDRRILAALEQAGTLPEASRSTLNDAGNSVATVAAKLAELNVANR